MDVGAHYAARIRSIINAQSLKYGRIPCESLGTCIPQAIGVLHIPELRIHHVVFTPKYRKKMLFGQIRRHLGSVFHELARRKECQIEEGHLMPDHVHMLISIPPKYSVAEVIGYLKGKSSIWIAQNVERKLRNFLGHKFWARGYFVSTVGRDEETIRAYIRNQEMADKQLDQMQFKLASS
jgi:putative transposase